MYEEPVIGTEEQKVDASDAGWSEVKELTGEELHGLLDKLQENEWSIPEAGYELEGPGGEVIGSAELAWEDLKLAFLTDEELEYAQHFTDAGWRIVPIQEVLSNPDGYIHLTDDQGE
jgi:hypothetical protein